VCVLHVEEHNVDGKANRLVQEGVEGGQGMEEGQDDIPVRM